jgi:hypothetical protein
LPQVCASTQKKVKEPMILSGKPKPFRPAPPEDQ